jgi:hypothetical protein
MADTMLDVDTVPDPPPPPKGLLDSAIAKVPKPIAIEMVRNTVAILFILPLYIVTNNITNNR